MEKLTKETVDDVVGSLRDIIVERNLLPVIMIGYPVQLK